MECGGRLPGTEPRGASDPALSCSVYDKLLSSLGEGKGVEQRAGAKVARGWACAWSQTVSKEYQTPGSVTLRTPAPTAVS